MKERHINRRHVIRLAPALAAMAFVTTCTPPPSVEEARAFLDAANTRLLELSHREGRTAWLQATHISPDSDALAAEARQAMMGATVELATQATRFDGLDLPPELARQMKLLKLALSLPGPADPAAQAELAGLAFEIKGLYGKGKYEGRPLGALEKVMAESRDYDELLDVWQGWRTIAPPMKPKYQRTVELGNAGARELGFADLGAQWRAKYDMDPDVFAAELDRLWEQVQPLYEGLHAHVRARLAARYGAEKVPDDGLIPAHLLGNMWAQEWGNIYPLVAPEKGERGYDLTELLRRKGVDEVELVRIGERFFSSLGFEPLPETFWERSLFVKPRDREVVCHASAWNVDNDQDLRIKMCIKIDAEDFVTVHHELGHNYYQRAYREQPFLFRDSANDGFHEAIGDAVALSVTPGYLVEIGLLDREPDTSADVALLLRTALDKVAFLPFGLVIDQWRWKVFSGEVTPGDYNAAWWELREKYQGVKAPVARSESDFDPGAKYHVPAYTPYTRYFLAHILQFQFHRAMCRDAGYEGPLYRCSVYGSEEAGARLQRMMEMGMSRPWPDALEALTGQREIDATAVVEYFKPLLTWLEEQNQGRKVGY
jgi:peptidyl-dipeptidase A